MMKPSLGKAPASPGIVGNRDLIRVAVARHPQQAIPLSGSYSGSASSFLGMTVEVKVAKETGA